MSLSQTTTITITLKGMPRQVSRLAEVLRTFIGTVVSLQLEPSVSVTVRERGRES